MSETLKELRHVVLPEFVFGDGARRLVPRFLRNFGSRKPLVVSDDGVMSAGWTGEVLGDIASEGMDALVFADVTGNPRSDEIAAGSAAYEHEGCDAIVAVGGGSVMDCAKGIGIQASNRRGIVEFQGVDQVVQPIPPLICVSTTTTGADVSQFAIISDAETHEKLAVISKAIIPDVSLLDPIVYTTMTPSLTAACGMDSLSQAIEAYVSNAHSPFTDLLALDGVRRLTSALPAAVQEPEDVEYRSELMLGNLQGAIAFSNASLGLVHAAAHSVGGLTDAHHGECISAMLPAVVAFNFAAVPERYAAIARAMGLDVEDMSQEELRDALLDAIVSLRRRIGAPEGLTGFGVRPENIPWLVDKTLGDPTMLTNPRPATAMDIEAVYERSLE